jgi:calcineurin-like phosphoesterase family protein
MSTSFFASDLHFFHGRLLTFDASRWNVASTNGEHTEAIIDAWNRKVHAKDTVRVLGDVVMGDKSDYSVISRLNGRKHLILGNHDSGKLNRLQPYFKSIHGVFKYRKGVILTHVPIHPAELICRWRLNIHGHLHGRELTDPRYFNVNLDVRPDFAPTSWDEVKMARPWIMEK